MTKIKKGGEKRKMRKLKGFTLIELMIVMAVIAVLATMALVGFRTAQMAARDTERAQIVRGIQVALECWMGDWGTYGALGANCNPTGLTGCWQGAAPVDPLGGALASCAGCSCTYVGSGTTSYTITLVGERGATQVFTSPQ